MPFKVKELFYTLQGEGVNAGRPAVFCRFAGCNLWTGLEADRARQGGCALWCDTDFVGGAAYPDAARLALAMRGLWPGGGPPFAVLTGGEPTLQATDALIRELHALDFDVAMESNGTKPAPANLDWLTVSPKFGTELLQRTGDELKVVWPQPFELRDLEHLDFRHFLLSPMAGVADSQALALAACLDRPRWRLSLQIHKLVGIR